MNHLISIFRNSRGLSSRLGSLLLLFQRTPVVQMLFPEARLLSSAGVGEITTWAVATVVGLGAYDTVAGATTIAQIAPTPVVNPIPSTAGTALSVTIQVLGAPGSPKSWSVTGGSLPTGMTKTNSGSTCTIAGIPTTPGNYTFTIKAWQNSNNTGGSISKALTIDVAAPPPPTITKDPVSTTINKGSTATLIVNATGTSPTFQWYIGIAGNTGNPVSGATSASYTTPSTLAATTTYWAQASNAGGTDNSKAATVTVITPPTITSHPGSTQINKGSSTTLTVTASGTSPTYQWYIGIPPSITSPVSGATSASYITPTTLAATTTYWARASNAAGVANSNAATVTVITPPSITTQPASASIDSGATATLTIGTSGTSPSIQWYAGNSGETANPIPSATTASFTTPTLTAPASYWAKASNDAGTVDSNTAAISINAPAGTFTNWQGSQFTPGQLADPATSGPNADPDGDGISNNKEYIFGFIPMSGDPSPSPATSLSSGQFSLSFVAKAATGPGYTGLTRHYALESASAPDSPAWSVLPGYTDIVGTGQTVNFSATPNGSRLFYRLNVRLTP